MATSTKGRVAITDLVRGDRVKVTIAGTDNVVVGVVDSTARGRLGGAAAWIIPDGSFYGLKLVHPFEFERLEAATS